MKTITDKEGLLSLIENLKDRSNLINIVFTSPTHQGALPFQSDKNLQGLVSILLKRCENHIEDDLDELEYFIKYDINPLIEIINSLLIGDFKNIAEIYDDLEYKDDIDKEWLETVSEFYIK